MRLIVYTNECCPALTQVKELHRGVGFAPEIPDRERASGNQKRAGVCAPMIMPPRFAHFHQKIGQARPHSPANISP